MYRDLWEIEDTFKIKKTNLGTRPIYVKKIIISNSISWATLYHGKDFVKQKHIKKTLKSI